MTDVSKPTRKARGVPIPLGGWWHLQIKAAFGELSHEAVAKMVTAAAGGTDSWTGNEIGKLRREGGTQPTLPLIRAISASFPVANPVFIAQSAEEATEMRGVQLKHQREREKLRQQQVIEGAEVKTRMAAAFAGELGDEEIAKTNAAAAASEGQRKRRVLRDQRKRTKK